MVRVMMLIVLSLAAGALTAEPPRPKLKLRADSPDYAREAWQKSEAKKDELIKNEKALVEDETAKLRAIERARAAPDQENGKNGTKDSRGRWVYAFHSLEERRQAAEKQKAAIAKLQDTIKRLKSDPAATLYEQGTADDVREGFVGRFGYCKVSQVIGKTSMIVELHPFLDKDDDDTYSAKPVDVFVDGPSTEGVVDGAELQLQDIPFLVKGTKSYTTVLGAKRTVWHLVQFKMSDYIEK